jgi:hypothetical protein
MTPKQFFRRKTMRKSFLKLYLVTFLFILSLGSVSFAGDAHCPVAPPPPPTDGDQGAGGRMANSDPTKPLTVEASQIIQNIWDFLNLTTRSF